MNILQILILLQSAMSLLTMAQSPDVPVSFRKQAIEITTQTLSIANDFLASQKPIIPQTPVQPSPHPYDLQVAPKPPASLNDIYISNVKSYNIDPDYRTIGTFNLSASYEEVYIDSIKIRSDIYTDTSTTTFILNVADKDQPLFNLRYTGSMEINRYSFYSSKNFYITLNKSFKELGSHYLTIEEIKLIGKSGTIHYVDNPSATFAFYLNE